MATITHTTLHDVSETPVSRAFCILLERLSDLVRLERPDGHHGSRHVGTDHADHRASARSTVLHAAQTALTTTVEHPLDGPLHRLASLCELQMTLDCPEERTQLFAVVMSNLDIFRIEESTRHERHVRDLQQEFFTHYAALVEGPRVAPVVPDTSVSARRDPIPA